MIDLKEFRSTMYDLKYKKISIRSSPNKTGKRKKIGFEVITEKKTKMFITFSELRISYPKIIAVFLHNKKNKKENKKFKSNLDKYDNKKSIKSDSELIRFIYPVPKLLQVLNIQDVNHKIIDIFLDYTIHRSDMYNITTFTNTSNTIVLTKNKIELKKTSDPETAVDDISKLIKLIGWYENDLKILGVEKLVNRIKPIPLPQGETGQEEKMVNLLKF